MNVVGREIDREDRWFIEGIIGGWGLKDMGKGEEIDEEMILREISERWVMWFKRKVVVRVMEDEWFGMRSGRRSIENIGEMMERRV